MEFFAQCITKFLHRRSAFPEPWAQEQTECTAAESSVGERGEGVMDSANHKRFDELALSGVEGGSGRGNNRLIVDGDILPTQTNNDPWGTDVEFLERVSTTAPPAIKFFALCSSVTIVCPKTAAASPPSSRSAGDCRSPISMSPAARRILCSSGCVRAHAIAAFMLAVLLLWV